MSKLSIRDKFNYYMQIINDEAEKRYLQFAATLSSNPFASGDLGKPDYPFKEL